MARYYHLNEAGTTTLEESGGGILHTVSVNAANSATVTIYDGTDTSGPVIAAIFTNSGNGNQHSFIYDVAFIDGLTVDISAGGASPDLTFSIH